jgi:hypothetical protein
MDFAYWWSFSGGGSAPAACAAGLFLRNSSYPFVLEIYKEMSSRISERSDRNISLLPKNLDIW